MRPIQEPSRDDKSPVRVSDVAAQLSELEIRLGESQRLIIAHEIRAHFPMTAPPVTAPNPTASSSLTTLPVTEAGQIPLAVIPPGVDHIPRVKTGDNWWRQMIRDWNEADPTRNLQTPLGEFDPKWLKGSNRARRAVLHGKRKNVIDEWKK